MTGDTFVAASNITTLSARLSQMIMVADLTTDDKRAISDKDREYLKEYRRPPIKWLIYLCRADLPAEAGQFYQADAFHLVDLVRGHAIDGATNLVVTFVLRKLCIHAITFPPQNYKGYIDARLILLWPSSGHDSIFLRAALCPRER
jgi:hypothetical protein